MNYEQKLVKDLAHNEHIVYIIPLDELELEYETTLSTMKSMAKNASLLTASIIAGKLVKEFGYQTDKVILKEYRGKQYVIFKGHPHNRTIFRGTRYLNSNPTVVRMAVGPKGIARNARSGFAFTAVLYVGIEVFDYFIRDSAILHELLGSITAELIKIGLASIAAAAVGLVIGSAAVIGTSAAAPVIAAIAAGWVTGYILDKIDNRVGATKALIEAYRKIGIELSEIEYNTLRWYDYLQENPSALKQIFGGFRIPMVGGY